MQVLGGVHGGVNGGVDSPEKSRPVRMWPERNDGQYVGPGREQITDQRDEVVCLITLASGIPDKPSPDLFTNAHHGTHPHR